jgi:hypothetical protein
VLLWLLAAEAEGMVTEDLGMATHADSRHRVGSATSDLRKLGLVATHRINDDRYGAQACHTAVAWVRQAHTMWQQLEKERLDDIPPLFGRHAWVKV